VRDTPLRRGDLDPDPLRQFDRWFEEAGEAVRAPEAMALATAAPDGAPSVRMVLLKQADAGGLVFFTHYPSRKGRELEANPQAALLFYWDPLGRQVRVEGRVERLPAAESDAYFETRPEGARAGAHVSRQSEVLESREELERRLAEVDPASRPEHWGGSWVIERLYP
jgi:pyridoxamine 5'-phosphate oxidase